MTTLRSQVTEFHQAFGQPIVDKPKVPSDERVRIRLRLIAEEFFEALDEAVALDTGLGKAEQIARAYVTHLIENAPVRVNMPAFFKELKDLDYVIEGTRLEFGVNDAPIAAAVHASNMAKLGPDGKPVVRTDGKIIKPKGWQPPDIEGELRKQGWQP